MNKIKVITILFLYTTLIVFSCSSLGKSESQEKEEISIQTEKENKVDDNSLKLPDGWSQQIEVTNEGTRSEGSIARLLYRYKELPACFELVVIGKSVFEYKPMEVLWDDHGYLYLETINKISIDSDNTTSSEEINQGWYQSSATMQEYSTKAGTPTDWIYVKTAQKAYWVSPEKVDLLVETQEIAPILLF